MWSVRLLERVLRPLGFDPMGWLGVYRSYDLHHHRVDGQLGSLRYHER